MNPNALRRLVVNKDHDGIRIERTQYQVANKLIAFFQSMGMRLKKFVPDKVYN